MSKKSINDFIPQIGLDLVNVSRNEVLEKVGEDVIKEIVVSILNGGNVRTLTEGLTRRRLTLSNGAMFIAFLKSIQQVEAFKNSPFKAVEDEFFNKSLSNEQKAFLNWMIGLSGKGIQNILRDDDENVRNYLKNLESALTEASSKVEDVFGELSSEVRLGNEEYFLNWNNLLHVFMAIGAQTLTIRGSEKSVYGKLFERLILGSVLSILGFTMTGKDKTDDMNMVFWLSDQGDKREADATLLVEPGKGARFDIGFIGRGNSEISLDKVSRFERELERGRQTHYMSTIVLVDRIGGNSRIQELAQQIDGDIIQMSMSYWVKEVAQVFKDRLDLESDFIGINDEKYSELIEAKIEEVDLSDFVA